MQKFFITILVLFTYVAVAQRPCAVAKQQAAAASRSVPTTSLSFENLENRYDVKFHHLNLNVERTSKAISGYVRTVAQVVAPMDTFGFELHTIMTVDSVVMNGLRLALRKSLHERYAVLPATANVGDILDLTIYYRGTPPSGSSALGDGFGNATSPTWGNQVTWSLSQPFAAFQWWPCKQVLTDKIDSTWVFITTDTSNKAGSNGVLSRVVRVSPTKNRWEWKSHHAIDYYLISLCVARYVEYNRYAHLAGSNDSVLIQNFIYNNPATLTRFKASMDSLPAMVELFSSLFGNYPFADEKYGHCMAPIGGGMEHQTMTTQGYFEFTLNAHELAHQWFGNNVTCASWKDIFVNEGFASYSEYLALEKLQSKASADAHMLVVHQSVMSEPGGSVWFTDSTNGVRIFDSRLSYDKGSAILHTLRFLINNDAKYFAALRAYQNQFKHKTATAIDLKNILEQSTGIDMSDFYYQWFYGEGFPTFRPEWHYENNILVMTMNQTTSMPSITPFFKTPLEVKFNFSGGDTTVRISVDSNHQVYWFDFAQRANSLVIDPNNWLLNTAIITRGTDRNFGVGISEENSDLRVDVVPNPAQNILQVLTNTSFSRYKIYTLDGTLLQQGTFNNTITLEDLPNALYVLELSTDRALQKIKIAVAK